MLRANDMNPRNRMIAIVAGTLAFLFVLSLAGNHYLGRRRAHQLCIAARGYWDDATDTCRRVDPIVQGQVGTDCSSSNSCPDGLVCKQFGKQLRCNFLCKVDLDCPPGMQCTNEDCVAVE
jgi:hypothetical protein